MADKKKTSNHDNWVSALNYLNRFTDRSLKFSNLDERFCEDFKGYLLTTPSKRSGKVTLAKNSALSYFNKFKAALKQAYRDGYLQTDLNAKVQPIKQEETHRKFLTLEEVNKLAKSECSLPILKQAALFSALTGLRFSDIEKMVWSELEFIEGQGYFIHFRQESLKVLKQCQFPNRLLAYWENGNNLRIKYLKGLYILPGQIAIFLNGLLRPALLKI